MNSIDIRHGDCLEVLRSLPDNSVDSVVTDPPYGLSNTKPAQVADVLAAWVTGDTEAVPAKKGGFMGKDWDSFVPPPAVWSECLRVLKPGGHMAVFAGSRTQDLMGLSIRLSGFEIRDTLGWIYGSGFPKSMDVSKAIDKGAGAEREKVPATGGLANYAVLNDDGWSKIGQATPVMDSPEPVTSAAQQWSGWGTALKPAIEPIILARKPLDGTVAANVLAHGVGGLNIDASRVPIDGGERDVIDNRSGASANNKSVTCYGDGLGQRKEEGLFKSHVSGRFPANVLLDEHAAKEMDEQSGVSVSNIRINVEKDYTSSQSMTPDSGKGGDRGHNDSGGASRFFPVFKYQAKAPKKERPVIYKNNCECEEWQSQQKATTESTETEKQSWNTSTSGSSTTAQCQTDTTYTTSTTTSSTTGSKTSPASVKSSISESTQDARSETENGGSHANSAEVSNQSLKITGTSAKKAGHNTDGVGHATSEKWYTTSECEKCGEPRRKVQHVTVKPLGLMSWLVTLITPEGGTTLDPFAGTGTTLQAARDKGFAAIGVEQDEDYIALIEQRLAA